MMLFQSPELMWFEREECGLQSRKQGRDEDQSRNCKQENGERCYRHSLARMFAINPLVLRELGLLIIRAATTLKPFMDKGERISRMVTELVGSDAFPAGGNVVDHPFYRAYFQW